VAEGVRSLPKNAVLRRGRTTDLPAVLRGERAYMREIEPEQENAWTAALDANLADWIDWLDRTIVLEIDGVHAGYEAWIPDDDAAVLATIHVFEPFRRVGSGAILLRAFAHDAAAHGHSRLALQVHRDNPARRLYELHGFQLAGEDDQDVYVRYESTVEGATGLG
jgi:[ribosomal protein S18]-alanine N-acetyltransferase